MDKTRAILLPEYLIVCVRLVVPVVVKKLGIMRFLDDNWDFSCTTTALGRLTSDCRQQLYSEFVLAPGADSPIWAISPTSAGTESDG